MNAFRFAKLPPRANDPTRRYQIVTGAAHTVVGLVEVTGDAPDGDTLRLTVTCYPELSDADRGHALDVARRFADELAAGWGRQAAEAADAPGWETLPDGKFRTRLDYSVV